MKETGLEKVTKWFENNLQLILIVSALSAVFLPWLLSREAYSNFFAIPDVGSTIGGISQTILGEVTVILLFLTYRSQERELKSINAMNRSLLYMNSFNNMLKIHLDSVSHLTIDYYNKEVKGIYVYDLISTELRLIFTPNCIEIISSYKVGEIDQDILTYRLGQQSSRIIQDFIRYRKVQKLGFIDYYFMSCNKIELNLLITQISTLILSILKFMDDENKNTCLSLLESTLSGSQIELLYVYTFTSQCPVQLTALRSSNFFIKVLQHDLLTEFENNKSKILALEN